MGSLLGIRRNTGSRAAAKAFSETEGDEKGPGCRSPGPSCGRLPRSQTRPVGSFASLATRRRCSLVDLLITRRRVVGANLYRGAHVLELEVRVPVPISVPIVAPVIVVEEG